MEPIWLQKEQYDTDELNKIVQPILEYLEVSISEFENDCNIPEKVLQQALNGSRNIPLKHQYSIQEFIVKAEIDHLYIKEKVLGDLTEDDIISKRFWIDGVKEAIVKYKEDLENKELLED